MKVLIVRTFPNILNSNSYNIQELGLAKALRNNGVETDIVFYNGLAKSKKEITPEGITIYWQKAINIFKNGIFFHLSKIIENYDIIQVHEYDQIQSWLLYTFYSKKKIVIYHGPYYSPFNKGYNLKCKIFDSLFLPFSRHAKAHIQCLTKSPQATDFLKSKNFLNVETVGVGLDSDMLASNGTIDDTLSFSKKNFNALYIGKLEERRNITFLLKLAAKLHSEHPNFKLTIVGKFDNETYKEKVMPHLQKLIDSGAICYHEKLTQKELPLLYKTADVFLFTTNYDIFGMVLLEAMYYGAVPVSTLNGGSATLIDNGKDGFVINNFNLDAWSKTITELISDSDRLNKMRLCAQDKVQNHFTWNHIASNFITYYKSSF